jgi:transcriptional regulator with XRE-family HTH domain
MLGHSSVRIGNMEGREVRAVLAKNLKLYCGLRAMSQAALAEKAGISIPFLSDIERGNKWPYMETLINIANALKIDVYELLKPTETGPNASKNTVMSLRRASPAVSYALRYLSRRLVR